LYLEFEWERCLANLTFERPPVEDLLLLGFLGDHFGLDPLAQTVVVNELDATITLAALNQRVFIRAVSAPTEAA